MSTGRRGNKDSRSEQSPERSQETRKRLILAAEKLFGEEGIGAVSMRRINSEARQKNVSALHYHFGSREAIVRAIFDYRMTFGARRRQVLIEKLIAEGRQGDLRSLIHVAIWPLVEQMMSAAQPNYFVRFLAQAHRAPQFDSWDLVLHRSRRSIVTAYLMIVRSIDDLPRAIVHARTVMGLRHAIYVLADLDLVIEQRHPELRDEMLRFHANELIDMLAADLRAEMSPETIAAYEALAKLPGRPQAARFGPDTIQAFQRTAARRNRER